MLKSTLVAAAAVAGLALAQPAPAKADVDVDVGIGIGTPGYYGPGYGYGSGYGYGQHWPQYGGYPGGYYRPHYGISCRAGREATRYAGFRNVRTLECSGPVYRYIGWKRGQEWRVSVDARSGRVVRVRPIYY